MSPPTVKLSETSVLFRCRIGSLPCGRGVMRVLRIREYGWT